MSNFSTAAQEFLAQPRIAVTGVSRNGETGTGNYIYRTLRGLGKQVFAINPNTDTVESDKCYPSVQAIPGGVDGVVIINRPEVTEQVVQDCVEAGVKRIWMHNNTFMGSSVSEKGVALCRENGVTVIAGACPMMFLDPGHKFMRVVLGMMGRLPEVYAPSASGD